MLRGMHMRGEAALTEVARQGRQQAGCLGGQLGRGGAPLPPQQQPQAVPGCCARLPRGFPARHRRRQRCQASGGLLPLVAACCTTTPTWSDAAPPHHFCGAALDQQSSIIGIRSLLSRNGMQQMFEQQCSGRTVRT